MAAADQYNPPPGAETIESYCLYVIRERVGVGFAISVPRLSSQATAFFSREIGESEIRGAIRILRQAYQPICSSKTSGYWWPVGLKDAFKSIDDMMRDPARDLLLSARRMREGARRLFGNQLELL